MGRVFALAQDRELGHELRKRREAAGMTGVELAEQLEWTTTRVSRMELGMLTPSSVDVITYLAFCDVQGPDAEDLVALCHRPDRNIGYWLSPHNESETVPDNLRSLIYHETRASAHARYEPMVVDGLLQTPAYARALMERETWRSPQEIEGRIRLRMDRQEILNQPNRARYTFFLHEDGLRRPIVDATAMHEQMLKILLVSALDHVTVRVVPRQATFGGQFFQFRFEKHEPLVYLENHCTGLFLEDRKYVGTYCQLVMDIADVALNGGESREFIAALASEYDQASLRSDDVKEEQL